MRALRRSLMCCQCGEGDQTLSLILLQLTAAPSHTSALPGRAFRACDAHERILQSPRRRMEPVTRIAAGVIGSVGYALRKRF